ncbi:hypothetical protein PSPO01_15016 [Paraphaeosphaeria sporulosa]
MNRHVSLKRTPSHVEERKIMKALERVLADQSGIHPAKATAPPEVSAGEIVGELELDDTSDKGSESSKVAGMSVKDRRALWESTLPQKSSVLPVRPRSGHELEKLVGHIWIDTALGRINVCSHRIAFVVVWGLGCSAAGLFRTFRFCYFYCLRMYTRASGLVCPLMFAWAEPRWVWTKLQAYRDGEP